VLSDQQFFFSELRERVGTLVKNGRGPREIRASVGQVRADLTAQGRIARYVGDGFASQVEKVVMEMTGQGFPDDGKPGNSARLRHAVAHGWPTVIT
jgi:hypothetical protein